MADDEWLDHLNKLFIYLFSLIFFAKMGNNIFEQHKLLKPPTYTTNSVLLSKERIESMWSAPLNKDSSASRNLPEGPPFIRPLCRLAAAAVVWPVVVVPCARLDVPFLFSIIYLNFLQKNKSIRHFAFS